jgi:hypothetical protein
LSNFPSSDNNGLQRVRKLQKNLPFVQNSTINSFDDSPLELRINRSAATIAKGLPAATFNEANFFTHALKNVLLSLFGNCSMNGSFRSNVSLCPVR